ncbi:hypothetical protein V8J82_21065 [Gymnodinialimonas sp. 2305UL16-5]|uniref:hypothetical protein n=1 Tax=Gymnodinialimonas mytili TaxID=3126503 RepID=UPI0030B36CF1
MTGPKFIALVLFPILSLASVGFLAAGMLGITAGLGLGIAAAVAVGIWVSLAQTNKGAFKRGCLSLGAVLLGIPLVMLALLGPDLFSALTPTSQDGDYADLTVAIAVFMIGSIVLAMLVGVFLVVIGALLRRSQAQNAPYDP